MRGRAVFSYALIAHRLETFQPPPDKPKCRRSGCGQRGTAGSATPGPPGGSDAAAAARLGSATRRRHPPARGEQRPPAPALLGGYRSAEGAGGDATIPPQTCPAYSTRPRVPFSVAPLFKISFLLSPLPVISLSVLGCQIPCLMSSSRSQSGKGPPGIN